MTTPNEKTGFLLLIEWDGKTPPTTWYNRLHAYGLWTRGDKEISPLARRESEKGFIFQEGALMLRSRSFAELLIAEARHCKAKSISLSHITTEDITLSPQDEAIYFKIIEDKSKRGPKRHKDGGMYQITCLEEARTSYWKLTEAPYNCQECGSTRIQYQKGKKAKSISPQANSIEEAWITARFHSSFFQLPPIDTKKGTPIEYDPSFLANINPTAWGYAQEATHILTKLKVNPKLKYRGMDVGYCIGLLQESKEARLRRRTDTLEKYYRNGGEKYYSMSVPKNLDIIDLASMDSVFMELL